MNAAQLHRANELGKVFSPSAPINTLSLFAGRIPQLRTVLDAINQRGRHVLIYGERGVGKTSLASILGEVIVQNAGPSLVVQKVICDGGDRFDSVWRKVFKG